jgi:hypothetical protein
VCWFSDEGSGGCSAFIDGTFNRLFYVPPGTLAVQGLNSMAVRIVGQWVTFQVNNQVLGTIQDTRLTSGYWGVYGEYDSGTATARFESLTIFSVP